MKVTKKNPEKSRSWIKTHTRLKCLNLRKKYSLVLTSCSNPSSIGSDLSSNPSSIGSNPSSTGTNSGSNTGSTKDIYIYDMGSLTIIAVGLCVFFYNFKGSKSVFFFYNFKGKLYSNMSSKLNSSKRKRFAQLYEQRTTLFRPYNKDE